MYRRVVWNVLERLSKWFNRSNIADDSADGTPDGTGADEATSSLFHCRVCDVTFISLEMKTCPRCDRAIDEIESERELDRFQLQ